jgi:triacylglycerol lipase
MYFPKYFDKKISIELGLLVNQAYGQFAAFKKEAPWELSGGYRLLHKIVYAVNPKKTQNRNFLGFDFSFLGIDGNKKSKDLSIPIGFIAEQANRLYLIFRGTLTANEWARNLSFNMKDYLLPDHGRVHEGFIQTYRQVRETILDFFSKNGKNKKLRVAGHSLGGALATLAVPDLKKNTKLKITGVYTFGSPRVGDDAFVRAYNRAFGKRTFRLVNTSDIVPSLPLPIPFGPLAGGYFSHVDTPVDCTVQGNDIEINHHIDTYLAALQENVGRHGLFAHDAEGLK